MATHPIKGRGRAPRHKPASPLSAIGLGVLRRVANGEALTGSREFPYPYQFRFGRFDPGYQVLPADRVTPGIIAQLVELRLIDATRPRLDLICYRITEAGKSFAKDGPPPFDDSQLDWPGGAA